MNEANTHAEALGPAGDSLDEARGGTTGATAIDLLCTALRGEESLIVGAQSEIWRYERLIGASRIRANDLRDAIAKLRRDER